MNRLLLLVKTSVQEKYTEIPEKVITMALESVDFNEQKAQQILQIMVQEEQDKKDEISDEVKFKEENLSVTNLTSISTSQSKQSLKSLLKSDIARDKSNLSR